MKNLMVFLVLLCGCHTAVTVKNDPLVGLPTSVVPTLPALKIVDEPKYLPAPRDEPKYLPPLVTLGHPVPIEPEPLPRFDRPELPPLPPLFPDGF